MKMKKLACIGLISVLLLLVACNSATPKAEPTKSATASSKEIDFGLYCGAECKKTLTLQADPASIKGKVGFAVAALTFPYGAALKKLTEEAAKTYFPNIELLVGDGQDDPTIQTRVVDDFISKGIDVLIINAVEQDALVPVVKRAMDKGIKVISIDRTVNTPVLTTIKANDVDMGMNAGKYIVDLFGGKANIVELQGSAAASPTIDRHKGFTEAIKGSNINVIASQNADYDQALALKVMEDILQRFPKGKIDGLFSQADEMTMGAIQAIKAAGREDEIKIIGIDGQESVLDLVAKGKIEAISIYPVVSPMGIVAAAKAIAGEKMPDFIKLDSPVADKKNISQYQGTTY
jgi:ribose transport system substrate-binding protein